MMKMKKVLSTMLVAALFVSTLAFSGTAASATELKEAGTSFAVLEDPETGRQVEIPIQVENIVFPTAMSTTSSSAASAGAMEMSATLDAQALRAIGVEYTDETWDSSNSIKAWGRFFYNKRSSNQILITKVTGNWRNNSPNHFTLSNYMVGVSCYSPEENNFHQKKSWRPNGGFTYYTGFRTYAKTGHGVLSQVGMSTNVTVKNRYGGSFDLNLYMYPWG